jgi:hypothetical protein
MAAAGDCAGAGGGMVVGVQQAKSGRGDHAMVLAPRGHSKSLRASCATVGRFLQCCCSVTN